MYNHDIVYVYISHGAGSVFKSGWVEPPQQWHQPELATEFELLRSVKDISNKVLETARIEGAIKSSLEAELTLGSNSVQLSDLLSKHLHGPLDDRTNEFSLSDLLIVSNVNLVSEREWLETQEPCHTISELVDTRGEMVEVKVVVRQASRSGKHKCPRCWKWTSSVEGGLCLRCDGVMNNNYMNRY